MRARIAVPAATVDARVSTITVNLDDGTARLAGAGLPVVKLQVDPATLAALRTDVEAAIGASIEPEPARPLDVDPVDRSVQAQGKAIRDAEAAAELAAAAAATKVP